MAPLLCPPSAAAEREREPGLAGETQEINDSSSSAATAVFGVAERERQGERVILTLEHVVHLSCHTTNTSVSVRPDSETATGPGVSETALSFIYLTPSLCLNDQCLFRELRTSGVRLMFYLHFSAL